jgi:hypothetical protein
MRPPVHIGDRTLDTIMEVWHGACDGLEPPSWEGISDLIWHPWFVHLVVVESRQRMKPGECLTVFPVAALLLGLQMCGFRAGVPVEDYPRTAALSAMTRAVSMRGRMVLRSLPGNASADGGGGLLVAGVPLASVGRVERVLFAVVNAGG